MADFAGEIRCWGFEPHLLERNDERSFKLAGPWRRVWRKAAYLIEIMGDRALALALAVVICTISLALRAQAGVRISDVVATYADIAQAGYEDSLATARQLKAAIDAFLAKPTEDNLSKARAAWIAARVPYQQTEAYRFGNAIVDDWEGKVNAWPLDEGLIDYVASDYGTESDENELYVANVVANTSARIDGIETDLSVISKELIAEVLQEAGGIEANVASGYHAIEFLLWQIPDAVDIRQTEDVINALQDQAVRMFAVDDTARGLLLVTPVVTDPCIAQDLLPEATDPFFFAVETIVRVTAFASDVESVRGRAQAHDRFAGVDEPVNMFHLVVRQIPKPKGHDHHVSGIQSVQAGDVPLVVWIDITVGDGKQNRALETVMHGQNLSQLRQSFLGAVFLVA